MYAFVMKMILHKYLKFICLYVV
ncbi:rCG62980 [Rattus norvegicus]|uniref:RCG62980 n=1 Tax=Rattus norvegicus TaxID=10116 RepID=A6HNB9_RAT|nr:rCG62980 [Rattus norvegicus]